METLTQLKKTDTIDQIMDLSGLFVIKDIHDPIDIGYWSGSGNFINNINEARLYKTREHAQIIADTLLATKPIVVEVKIIEV